MSSLFRAFLESIPKNRSEMVSELELPDDISVSPYLMEEVGEFGDPISLTNDSISEVMSEDRRASQSSESSLALSRAMTDSDIDYERFRRLKNRSLSDPWGPIRGANEAFPSGYRTSLESFMDTSLPVLPPSYPVYTRNTQFNEELRGKMERFFEEECRVFSPDDPSLEELQEALLSLEETCDTVSTIKA